MKHDNNVFKNWVSQQDEWFEEDSEQTLDEIFGELNEALAKEIKKKKRKEMLFLAAQVGVAVAITIGVGVLERKFQ